MIAESGEGGSGDAIRLINVIAVLLPELLDLALYVRMIAPNRPAMFSKDCPRHRLDQRLVILCLGVGHGQDNLKWGLRALTT